MVRRGAADGADDDWPRADMAPTLRPRPAPGGSTDALRTRGSRSRDRDGGRPGRLLVGAVCSRLGFLHGSVVLPEGLDGVCAKNTTKYRAKKVKECTEARLGNGCSVSS